jgi:hypothetical protein
MKAAAAAADDTAGTAADDDCDDEAACTALNIQGRSKGVALLAGDADFVVERLRLSDGRMLVYKQAEAGPARI